MWKPILKWTRRIILALGLFGLLALVLPRLLTTLYAAARIYSAANAPYRRVAIVFGAGLRRDGTPTGILRERVETAAQLYFSGRTEKLLLSGDNRTESYNEPEAMRQYALSLGVPADALVLDYAGRRTYDTCYRAMAIFGLDQAILVTQRFHLPRALFTCNALGLQAVGVEAGGRYRRLLMLIWNVREQLATLGAFSDIYIERPVPVLGRREPIFAESQ